MARRSGCIADITGSLVLGFAVAASNFDSSGGKAAEEADGRGYGPLAKAPFAAEGSWSGYFTTGATTSEAAVFQPSTPSSPPRLSQVLLSESSASTIAYRFPSQAPVFVVSTYAFKLLLGVVLNGSPVAPEII